MSTDPIPGNAAKKVAGTTTAAKAHNSSAASPAKTAKKAVPAKATDPSKPAATSAVPAGEEPHAVVFDLLTGKADANNLADQSPEVQALLATVMLEQRREVLFDANNTYIGGDNFTALINQLLGGPTKSRVITVMTRMRKDGAYTSKGTGTRAKFTFTGTDQARNIAHEVAAYHKAAEKPKLTGTTPGPIASTPPEYARGPEPGVTASVPSPFALADLLAGSITETVWRLAGYDPHMVDLVIAELQNRRFA